EAFCRPALFQRCLSNVYGCSRCHRIPSAQQPSYRCRGCRRHLPFLFFLATNARYRLASLGRNWFCSPLPCRPINGARQKSPANRGTSSLSLR
ncbi:hypothetical protein BIW11_05875, partial [Tropilaelaps mercedesae]